MQSTPELSKWQALKLTDIEGIDCIKLDVADWDSSQQFLDDLGLTLKSSDGTIAVWQTLNGSSIIIERANTDAVREVHWGVTDVIFPAEVIDPAGIKVVFQHSQKRKVDLVATATNGWNSVHRVDQAVPTDTVDAIEVCHIVLATKDLETTEKFYTDLGFVVSDRLIGRGTFLRTSSNAGHHDLFLIQSTEDKLHHIAITVKDIYQVFAGGIRMEKQGWGTEIGPGRHPISSSFFWYFKSPLGGMIEYTCNEDFLTRSWVPRDLEYSVGMTTEWAVEGGIDPTTKRQRK